MRADLKARLLRNISALLGNRDLADVTVKVGQEQDTKTYLLHSAILGTRSPYFATALSSNWVKRVDNIITFTKPNITPQVFEIILQYLYAGDIDINEHEIPTIIDLLIAADELCLAELVECLQLELLEDHAESLKQNFVRLRKTVFRFESLKKLQEFCTDIAVKNPETIFRSDDFTQLPINMLAPIIERDNLDMKESDLWDYLVKWGAAQVNLNVGSVTAWSSDDFSSFYEQIKECMPFIRFFNMSSVDFYNKVKPFARILPGTVYEDLLRHYLIPGSHDEKVKPRAATTKTFSQLITDQQMAQIEAWINGKNTLTPQNLPSAYNFNLLLQGSRDGFAPSDFHRSCDNKGPTVTLVKVKDTGQIIGGFSPQSWSSDNDGEWRSGIGSFIFSFGSEGNTKPILSRFAATMGVFNTPTYGPVFGWGFDLALIGDNFETSNASGCMRFSYKHGIMEGSDTRRINFSVEDYEVFQVVNKHNEICIQV